MHNISIQIDEAEARALRRSTGKRTLEDAVVAIIEKAAQDAGSGGVVLEEGSKKYRATPKLLAAVAGFERRRAVLLTDAQFAKLAGV